MTFQKNWDKKTREQPNKMRKFPTFAFRSNKLSDEAIIKLQNLKNMDSSSEFICQAIEEKIYRETYPGIWLVELMEANYDRIGVLRRKIGSKINKQKSKDNNAKN